MKLSYFLPKSYKYTDVLVVLGPNYATLDSNFSGSSCSKAGVGTIINTTEFDLSGSPLS